MKTKVMLINPLLARDQALELDSCFPHGLLYLATVLKKNNMDVVIVDVDNFYQNHKENFNETEYIENIINTKINHDKPDIIGIGCLFSGAFRSVKEIARKIKDRFPDIPIAVGGIHPTLFAREILEKYTYIDYVVIGEGEYTFLELIKCITTNKQELLGSMDGIAFRRKGDIILNPKTKFIDNLDALPFVDYNSVNVEDYRMDTSGWYSPKKIKIGQPFPIISSRSCPQRCNFCSMWLLGGPHFRPRSPDNVVDEMEHLYNAFNVRYFQFMDDNLTYDKKRILEICNGILKRNMDIQFDTPNGVAISRLDQETIGAMVNAGLIRISIAIESGSEYIRNKVMGKGLLTEKIYEVVEACAKHSQLFINSFFIIGMPQETDKTLDDTYEMIKRLPLDKFAINFATPFPGTRLFDYCIEHKLLPYKFEDYVDNELLQPRTEPHFKPHNLTIDALIIFKEKCFDYLREKRRNSNLPNNYPFRYKEE